jgi:hypothetical protein
MELADVGEGEVGETIKGERLDADTDDAVGWPPDLNVAQVGTRCVVAGTDNCQRGGKCSQESAIRSSSSCHSLVDEDDVDDDDDDDDDDMAGKEEAAVVRLRSERFLTRIGAEAADFDDFDDFDDVDDDGDESDGVVEDSAASTPNNGMRAQIEGPAE